MTRAELEMEFAGAALGWVERELEMTDPEIGQALGVDRKTIYRWRKRESAPAPEQRKRMEKLTPAEKKPNPKPEAILKYAHTPISMLGSQWEELRQEWDELSKLEAKLSHLIQKDADEAVLTRQIDRVETARAAANKTRSLMLVQMLKVLTPEQRTRFTTLHGKWQHDDMAVRPGRTPDAPRRHER